MKLHEGRMEMEFKIKETLNTKQGKLLILEGKGKRRIEYTIGPEEEIGEERAREILADFQANAREASERYHAYVEVV
jgi:ribosomal protein S6